MFYPLPSEGLAGLLCFGCVSIQLGLPLKPELSYAEFKLRLMQMAHLNPSEPALLSSPPPALLSSCSLLLSSPSLLQEQVGETGVDVHSDLQTSVCPCSPPPPPLSHSLSLSLSLCLGVPV